MKKSKLMLWFLLIFLFSGCAEESTSLNATTEIPTVPNKAIYRFAIGYSGSGYDSAFEAWRDQLLELTDGNVELVLYGDNVLGEGKDMLQATMAGTLSITASSTSVHTDFIPEASILDIPACFPEYIQPFRTYEGEFFEAMDQCYRTYGLKLLSLRTGEKWIVSSSQPIDRLENLNDMRLRTSGSKWHNVLYERLGIIPVNDVGLNGIAYILDEHEVDGIETTASILNSQNLLNIQPYALSTDLFVMSSSIVMNLEAYSSLPSDYQKLLQETICEIIGQQQNNTAQKAYGLKYNDFSTAEKETLVQNAAVIRDEILQLVSPKLEEALKRENAAGR